MKELSQLNLEVLSDNELFSSNGGSIFYDIGEKIGEKWGKFYHDIIEPLYTMNAPTGIPIFIL